MSVVTWSDAARADFHDLDTEFAELSPEYAYRVGRAALAAGRFLAEYPKAGPIYDGVQRKWLVRQTDYVLLYRVVPGGVEIVRMQHAMRDWRPDRMRPAD